MIEFFKEEYEKLQEPIRLAEELERERKLLVGPKFKPVAKQPQNMIARDEISFN